MVFMKGDICHIIDIAESSSWHSKKQELIGQTAKFIQYVGKIENSDYINCSVKVIDGKHKGGHTFYQVKLGKKE